jgi:hypothetical protein
MDEPARVRVREAGGQLPGDSLCLLTRIRLALDEPVFQRPSTEILEHHEGAAIGLAVVVEATDVRVGEPGHGVRLTLEARRVSVPGEQFQGDAPAELDVVGSPDL